MHRWWVRLAANECVYGELTVGSTEPTATLCLGWSFYYSWDTGQGGSNPRMQNSINTQDVRVLSTLAASHPQASGLEAFRAGPCFRNGGTERLLYSGSRR
jgi:hypothetical protein